MPVSIESGDMSYGKSPIVETLIDIKTEARSGLSLELLQGFATSLRDSHPRTETRFLGQGQFTFGAEDKATVERKPFALVLFRADEKQILQVRTDGLTSSRLAPYTGWKALREETSTFWRAYRDFAKPKSVTRLAVRYINQFIFPGPSVELEDYLNTFPELSRKLPAARRDMISFTMRLTIPQPDLNGFLVITEGPGNLAPGAQEVPIVLDLELWVEGLGIMGDDELWSKLEELHERQGVYFEASITDKTRGLIS
ncbi:MAG TPA: TIGR04255 family protein [Candidatus Acidoferrum sp.]|jgi:uncharacterized protein (TIGR04255 family)